MIGTKSRWSALMAVTAVAVLSSGAVQARSSRRPAKPAEKAQAESTTPQPVGTFGDWTAYKVQGKSRLCYALAQPKDRSPSSLKGIAAHIFISTRPAENVRNEISVIMGVSLKENAPAKAEIGTTSFDLVSKGQNAFVKNAADETRFIDLMKKSGKLVVKSTLLKGGQATDTYVLTGVGQALERVAKECQ